MSTIFGFALALLAVALGALALITFALVTRTRDMASQLGTLSTSHAKLSQSVESSTPKALRVEVDALGAALDALSKRNRTEFGRIWGKLTPRAGVVYDHDSGDVLGSADDPELGAMLKLQQASTRP